MHWTQPVAQPDLCELQGVVYIARQPQLADYRLHRLEEPDFADLRVYWQPVQAYADAPGNWFVTNIRAEADFTVYWEPNPQLAQGTVAITNLQGQAGCP